MGAGNTKLSPEAERKFLPGPPGSLSASRLLLDAKPCLDQSGLGPNEGPLLPFLVPRRPLTT